MLGDTIAGVAATGGTVARMLSKGNSEEDGAAMSFAWLQELPEAAGRAEVGVPPHRPE